MVKPKGLDKEVRQVYKVVERIIRRDGQILLIPEIEFESYWTSLLNNPEEIIELYDNHGTSDQFLSELNSGITNYSYKEEYLIG